MGAGASLPAEIDKSTARGLASSHGVPFDEGAFDAAADANGQVPLAMVMAAMQFDCFLTHDWGKDELGRDNHARVAGICRALKSAGYSPWFDEERMRGDINTAMSSAIAKSKCMVVFITQRYVEKASGNGPNGANDNCATRARATPPALRATLARTPRPPGSTAQCCSRRSFACPPRSRCRQIRVRLGAPGEAPGRR